MSLLVVLLVILPSAAWAAACNSEDGESADGRTTASTDEVTTKSGDINGIVGEDIEVGRAIITVRALQATFQPAVPEQRLSNQTPPAPVAGESFYQAQVRVENTAVTPIRVDAKDFVCAVGDSVVAIEPTRSGPLPRSLLKSTSLDLLLTFRAQSGYQPVLIYRPPWHNGVITVSSQSVDPVEGATAP